MRWACDMSIRHKCVFQFTLTVDAHFWHSSPIHSLGQNLVLNNFVLYCNCQICPKFWLIILISIFKMDLSHNPLSHVPTFMHYLYTYQEAQTVSLESSTDRSTTPVLETAVNGCGNCNNVCNFTRVWNLTKMILPHARLLTQTTARSGPESGQRVEVRGYGWGLHTLLKFKK